MKIKTFATLILSSAMMISCTQPVAENGPEVDILMPEEVSEAVDMLYDGIVEADLIKLDDITANELIYGHSSGKLQNKAEFIAEIMDPEALDFVTAELTDESILVSGETAIVRHVFSAETSNQGAPGNLSIGVMLVWQFQEGNWKLLARQAYRLQ